MTTLLRWTPFRDFDSMEGRVRRMLDEIGFAPALLPASDVYETDERFVIELEVPGFADSELGITVSDHTVTVKGERRETAERERRTFRLHERLERQFERRFELPADVDTEHITAKFVKGVLELQVPKIKEVPARQVEIATG
jgi:HSP20 family protein